MMNFLYRALVRTLRLLTACTFLSSLTLPALAMPYIITLPSPILKTQPSPPKDAQLVFSPEYIDSTLPLGDNTLVSASLENQGDLEADFAFADILEITWLDIQPISGTIAPTSTLPVSLTLDTSPLDQPGVFTTTLEITNTAPTGELQVPVTLTVTPPSGWGMLSGVVTTPGYCDLYNDPLPGALLTIQGAQETYTTTTRADGSYTWWLDADQSPISVTVAASGYMSASLITNIFAGQITRQDFNLIWLQPCLNFSPDEFTTEVGSGYTVTLPASLWNDGHRQASFSLGEVDGGIMPPKLPSEKPIFSPPASPGPLSLHATPQGAGSMPAPVTNGHNPWLLASQIPTGLARYARAQCPEDPDRFYLISGVEDPNIPDSNKVFRFDISHNSWNILAPIPSAVEGAAAVCYAGYIYVAGGSGSNQFYVYDIAAGSWAPGPPLPRPAYGAAIGAWQGRLFLVGGSTDFLPEHATPQVSIFDISTGIWSDGGVMPAAVVQPGFVQVFNFLYLAGGFDAGYPDSNSTVTQRFDMATGVWELGPAFTSQRAALALAASSRHLYAIGGDLNGGTNTDPMSDLVETLDLDDWPSSAWTDLGTPLPMPLVDFSGGFCSQTKTGGEVWAVGGFNMNTSTTNYYLPSGESCPFFSDVPWLSESLTNGDIPIGGTLDWSVSFSALPGMSPGNHTAQLMLISNDPQKAAVSLPVTMTISAPQYGVFIGPDQAGYGDPGTPITYTLLVANTGNGPTDSYTLTQSGGVWTATLSSAVTAPIPALQTEAVQVGVAVPAGALAGEQELTSISARSHGDPSQVYTALLTTTVNAVYGLNLEPGNQTGSGLPGASVAYSLSLLNTGNITATYQLTVTGGSWPVDLPSTVYTLGVGQAAAVDAIVHIPSTVLLGEADLELIQAQGPEGVLAVAKLRTLAVLPIPAISLTPASSQGRATVGSYADYDLTITNLSALEDSVTLTYTGTWPVQLPDEIYNLGPGDKVGVTVRVLVPSGTLPGEVQITTLLANSLKGASDSAVLLTTALLTYLLLPLQRR